MLDHFLLECDLYQYLNLKNNKFIFKYFVSIYYYSFTNYVFDFIEN